MFGYQSFYALFFIFLTVYVLILKKVITDRKIYCISCFILLVLLSALRGESVGGDLQRYLVEYIYVARTNSLKSAFDAGYHEPGYLLLIKLISLISPSTRSYLVCTSIISLLGPFILFYRYSKNIAVSILLYYAMGYYTNTFNSVRQSLAISIVFCVIPFLIERKFWKYIIGVIIATSIHYSAGIMLLIYPIFSQPLTVKRLLLFSSTTFTVIFVFFISIFQSVINVFMLKYDMETIVEGSEGKGYGMFTFYLFCFLLISFYYCSNLKKLNKEQTTFLSAMVLFQMLAASIQLSAPVFASMVRMTFYFFIPVVTLAVPSVHNTMKDRTSKTLLYVGAFTIAIIYMGMVYSYNPQLYSNGQAVIPYVLIDTTIF